MFVQRCINNSKGDSNAAPLRLCLDRPSLIRALGSGSTIRHEARNAAGQFLAGKRTNAGVSGVVEI